MNEGTRKFKFLRNSLYFNVDFCGVESIDDIGKIDDFTQFCLTDIESHRISNGGVYLIKNVSDIIIDAYSKSDLNVFDAVNVEESISELSDDFVAAFQ